MDEELTIPFVGSRSGVVLDLTDNELELLRRLVHSEQLNLNDLGKWAQIVNPMITAKLPLLNQLAEKLGEPDYTKEIYDGV